MQITSNTTPFLAELFASTDKHGVKHCVVVVKATFNVGPDGECQPATEQAPFIYADQHHGDPGKTSIRYESDFAPVKPRADVLLNASAIAPSGRTVTTLDVVLSGPGGSIPCFLGREDRPAMLGVRGEFLLTTLGMGGPDDDLRSNPLA